MEVKQFPKVTIRQNEKGKHEFMHIEIKVWRGPKGGISVHNDKMGIIANVPKDSKLYEQLARLFDGGEKIHEGGGDQ